MLTFPYLHCGGKSSPKIPGSILCSCLNPSRSEPQQDACSLSLDKDQEEEQSEEGDSPTASLQGIHSNTLPVKTASKASACVYSSRFALGILLRLEKQGFLVPRQAPAASLFTLSWQTCPLTAGQDPRSCDPAGFLLGSCLTAHRQVCSLLGNFHPTLELSIFCLIAPQFLLLKFCLSKHLSRPQP